jgi:hypothetical protein
MAENEAGDRFPVRAESANKGYVENLSTAYSGASLHDIRSLNANDKNATAALDKFFGDPKDPFGQKKDLDDGWWKSVDGWGSALKKAFGGGEDLKNEVGKQVDKEMTPGERKQYDTEKKEYDKQKEEYNQKFLQWATQANINAKMPEFKTPDMKDFPMMQERENRIEQKEKDIKIDVLKSMSPEERKELAKGMNDWQKEMDQWERDPGMRPMPGAPEAVRHYFDKVKHATESGAVANNDSGASDDKDTGRGFRVLM